MQINTQKTKIFYCNTSRKYDFFPRYYINNEHLEVVESTKLLGLYIQSNCKFETNTRQLVKKASSKQWFLRRLKTLGAGTETLTDIYKMFIRVNTEYCVPVWNGALSKTQRNSIEQIQRSSARIILGNNYYYDTALNDLDLELLETRRGNICLKFARSCVKDDRFAHIFPKRAGPTTRSKTVYIEPQCRKKRYENSCVPYLTRLLNSKS